MLCLLFNAATAFAILSNVARGQDICVEGYVMDKFCIERGTLLDKPSVVTLEGPEQHSVHCLVDVQVCRDSGFEILLDPLESGNQHCRGYALDNTGNNLMLAFARQHGRCSTCDGIGTQTQGLRATVLGTLKCAGTTTELPVISVTSIQEASVGCNANIAMPQPNDFNGNCVAEGGMPSTPGENEPLLEPLMKAQDGAYYFGEANQYKLMFSYSNNILTVDIYGKIMGWVGLAWAVSFNVMNGAQAVIGYLNGGAEDVDTYLLMKDAAYIMSNKGNADFELTSTAVSTSGEWTHVQFTRAYDLIGMQDIIMAFGDLMGDSVNYHSTNRWALKADFMNEIIHVESLHTTMAPTTGNCPDATQSLAGVNSYVVALFVSFAFAVISYMT